MTFSSLGPDSPNQRTITAMWFWRKVSSDVCLAEMDKERRSDGEGREWMWLEDKGESQGDWLIEVGNDSWIFVGSRRKNRVIYSCYSFTGLLAAQTLHHHLVFQNERTQ